MTTTETYRDVPGYEGLYQVSDRGNVMRVKSERVLKPVVTHKGYHQVDLSKENVQKKYSVHRLVALAFICNPHSKEQVNHIDWVKTNNSVENLEWNTPKENMRHSVDVLGNQLWPKGEKHYLYGKFWASNPTSKSVVQLSKEWVEVKRYWSTREAQRETGVAQSNICGACTWRYKSAGGFKWSYA